jgi:hypothetical protein
MPDASQDSADLSAGDPPLGGGLQQAPHGRLRFVAADGTTHDNVDVVRGFPVSAPEGPVAIVAADGRELAWVECLEAAAEPLRSALRRELAARAFLPVIERIESITDGEPADWSVVTDRGRRRFRVAHGDDVVRLPDGSAVVNDTDGLRYRIPAIARLTPRERHLVERTM